jgi:hypothetical protein
MFRPVCRRALAVVPTFLLSIAVTTAVAEQPAPAASTRQTDP